MIQCKRIEKPLIKWATVTCTFDNVGTTVQELKGEGYMEKRIIER